MIEESEEELNHLSEIIEELEEGEEEELDELLELLFRIKAKKMGNEEVSNMSSEEFSEKILPKIKELIDKFIEQK